MTADGKSKIFAYKPYEEYSCSEVQVNYSGYHACERPLDAFAYHPPASSVFYRVELGDRIKYNTRKDDTLVASNGLIIEKKLNLYDLMQVEKKYAKDHGNLIHSQILGNLYDRYLETDTYAKNRSLHVGDSSVLYTGFNCHAIAGNNSIVYAYSNSLACAGKNSVARTERYGISIVGKGGVAVSYNDGISIAQGAEAAAVAGKDGVVIGTKYSKVGESGVIVIRDFCDDDMYVMAGLNSVIVFAFIPKTKTLTIDGEKYKANTLYKVVLKDGNYTLEEEKDKSILETFAFTVDIHS